MSQNAQTAPEAMPPFAVMMQMITGGWVSQAICTAAELGLADLLAKGPRPCDALAQATNTHSPSLYRLLRALASVGVFAETENRVFQLTPLADCLREDAPVSLRAMGQMFGFGWQYRSWGELLKSVRNGETVFTELFGQEFFPYLDAHPDEAAVFNRAMSNYTALEGPALAAAYDFSTVKVLADVGGGHGGLLAAMLATHPHLRGILFDQPEVVAVAAVPRARCEVVGGDFFVSVPAGADAYMLRAIIHDWDEERAVAILRNVHRAMPAGGRLLLVENVLPAGDAPHFGKLLDLEMLVALGGRERTAPEYAELLAAAGFRLNRIVSTPGFSSFVEGVKAK